MPTENATPDTAQLPEDYDAAIKAASMVILKQLGALPAPVVMDVLTSCLMTAAHALGIPGLTLRKTVSAIITEAFSLTPEAPADLSTENLSALLKALGKDPKPGKHTIGFCGTTAQKG